MMKSAFLAAVAVLSIGAADTPAIHLDQIGFLPDGPKRAIVAYPARTPLAWQLLDATGKVAAQGTTTVSGDDAASGDHVHTLDFTAVRTPGSYRLQIGGSTTPAFAIQPHVFRPLARSALNFFYQQRAGVPIEARYAGGKPWARAAGHPRETVTCFKGPDKRGTIWPGCGYTLDVTGGWYDAGDHGKYIVNGGIALWTLQNLYETMRAFPDGSAALPEAGNGIDDLLDETKKEMLFFLSMQVPDAQHLALPVGRSHVLRDVDAGGMAHHKVADRNWTTLPTAPADDHEERLLYPPSTAATLNLAATAAQCARIWRTVDPVFARRCLVAAGKAYAAALRNPNILAAQDFDGSGGYGDATLDDEAYWATAELYAATKLPELLAALRRSPLHAAPIPDAPSWGSTAALGTITLATAEGIDPAERAAARTKIAAIADRFLADEARSGYRIPYAKPDLVWGSNGELLNRGILLALAHRFTGKAQYRGGAINLLDYVLGRNPLDQSYVSGFGWNPMRAPHHRFWAHRIDHAYPGPPPGVLSGGPNSNATDGGANLGKCAPQRCWKDDPRAYALNEVALNWNAPLVWVAASLDTP